MTSLPMRLAPLLALAACSAPQPANSSAPTPVATATRAAADTDSRAEPAPGELKTFKDWIVACDNTRRCAMASLGPDGIDFPAATLTVSRGAGPGGAFELAVEQSSDAKTDAAALILDRRRYALANALSGANAASVASGLANGRNLVIVGTDGKPMADVSLAGASAALRYIDAMQGRANTVTAAVAKGTQTATAVPPAPSTPVIGKAGSLVGATVDRALVARLQREAGCTYDGIERLPTNAFVLDGGRTLLIVPCDAGAYNVLSHAYVVGRDGQAARAELDARSGLDPNNPHGEGADQLVNAELDGGAIKTVALGRGLGDCGIAQRFVWDGARLRLAEQSEMRECRGNPHYLTTWRTKVVDK